MASMIFEVKEFNDDIRFNIGRSEDNNDVRSDDVIEFIVLKNHKVDTNIRFLAII